MDENTEAGELAHNLFGHQYESGRHTKTLILSATPFKGFTYTDEKALGDDHHEDFMNIVRWLSNGDSHLVEGISDLLRKYRREVLKGRLESDTTGQVREQLLRIMTRNERPRTQGPDGPESRTEIMEHDLGLPSPEAEEFVNYVSMKKLAQEVDAPFTTEYWKSAPYFVNFMGGYKLDEQVKEALKDPDRAKRVRILLKTTQRIPFDQVQSNNHVDPGNSRMRTLMNQTTTAGWWRLLWMPPTLPYLAPGGPYASEFAKNMTKRVIFSSWVATPSAVAALLSYEANRLMSGPGFREMTPEEGARHKKNIRGRLAYRMDREGNHDRPSSMSTLAIFWPMPVLAAEADPREWYRGKQCTAGSLEDAELLESVAVRLANRVETIDFQGVAASHWFEALRRSDSTPSCLNEQEIIEALRGAEYKTVEDTEGESRAHAQLMKRHVQYAREIRGRNQDRRVTPETLRRMAEVAAHSPANITYRSLCRLAEGQPKITKKGTWTAAARLASAFRTLFRRPETVLLLDQLIEEDIPYWRKVLRYCAWGNLQAVLDEHLHHYYVSQGSPPMDDCVLYKVAVSSAEAIELRSVSYQVFDPDNPTVDTRMPGGFALRFGGRREGEESGRQPLVRQAFNSPFWPFVLATTSVGQEGIDLHWWCHAVFHWNTPANPIDFEQREGRVDRYQGHAIRKNIVGRHGVEILASPHKNPWKAAYEIAEDQSETHNAFAPHWVFPGDAKVERYVAPYPLSVDEARLSDLKQSVAYYRLTFGQPRQEDMLELLKQNPPETPLAELRLDLSPPRLE